MWSTATGKPLATMDAASLVMTVAFTPDGKQVVAGTVDRHLRFFDAGSGKLGPKWLAHNGAVSGLAFDAKGEFLASCGFDSVVKVWNMASPGKLAVTLPGHIGPLTPVAFRGDGKYIASAGNDRIVRLWRNQDGTFKEVQVFRGHKDWITTLAFNDTGTLILSGGADRTLKVWVIASRDLALTSEHAGPVKCVAASPDGKLVASGCTDKTVKIWDAKTGLEAMTLRGHEGVFFALAFTPDNKTLFTSGDLAIRRWDIASGKELPQLVNKQNFSGYINPVAQLGIRPDGKRLIAWIPLDEHGTRVATFDMATGEERVQINDRDKHILAVAWSRDLKLVALGAKDGTVRIYEIDQDRSDKKPVAFQVLKDVAVTSVALAPDGGSLFVGGDNGEVLIIDPITGVERKKSAGHLKRVSAIVANPDGKRLATVGHDGFVKLWDTQTGKELRRWAMPPVGPQAGSLVNNLTFTADGRFLVTANANTTLFVLEVP